MADGDFIIINRDQTNVGNYKPSLDKLWMKWLWLTTLTRSAVFLYLSRSDRLSIHRVYTVTQTLSTANRAVNQPNNTCTCRIQFSTALHKSHTHLLTLLQQLARSVNNNRVAIYKNMRTLPSKFDGYGIIHWRNSLKWIPECPIIWRNKTHLDYRNHYQERWWDCRKWYIHLNSNNWTHFLQVSFGCDVKNRHTINIKRSSVIFLIACNNLNLREKKQNLETRFEQSGFLYSACMETYCLLVVTSLYLYIDL